MENIIIDIEQREKHIEKESHFIHRYTQHFSFCLLSTFSLSHAADAAVVEDENTLEFYFISSRSQLSLLFFFASNVCIFK